MSIAIRQNKCVGCRRCVEVCPGNLIKIDKTGKAYIKEPRDCWGCTSCLKECKIGAIAFFLGADIGGRGSCLSIQDDGDLRHWKITDPQGRSETITVNRIDANKY